MLGQGSNGAVALKIQSVAGDIEANATADELIAKIEAGDAAHVAAPGRIFAKTGKFTGRSAKDKFIVRDATTEDTVWWDNAGAMSRASFDVLLADMIEACAGENLHHQQLYAGADPAHRFNVDVFSPSAWHTLFIDHLLIKPAEADLARFKANVTMVHLPHFTADPARHGTRTDTCIALDLSRNIILICGTFYAGEMKKSVFSLFNFHAPDQDVLPMHCSANVGEAGDTALFFGLSGTGKTTLSTSATRALIGDDEHGWSRDGVFNLEGGCYAKAINLSAEREPEIHAAASQRGAVLENVTFDAATGEPDYADGSVTENTRIAYPLTAIANRVENGMAPAPQNVVFLTADAFGVLPPISRLTRHQAIYYFLSGYTAKVAGTERGVSEPQATFSACFGAPFMARHPTEYGRMLAQRIDQCGATVWLLNTGWSGGPYGVGERMNLPTTRRMLNAALNGELDDVPFHADPAFGLYVPAAINGVDRVLLDPRQTWADPLAYDAMAKKLKAMFEENFRELGADAEALAENIAA